MKTLFESYLPGIKLLNQGKVRDIYEIDDELLLIIASDRLSAFDVVLPQSIPGKGEVLTRISRFWFDRTKDIIPNHLSDVPLESVLTLEEMKRVGDRAQLVKRLNPLPIEAIVRGYIIGSGWKDYQRTGGICGIRLPIHLRLADKIPLQAIYTPSSKAAVGDHDENIDFEATVKLVGLDLANQIKKVSMQIYESCAKYALTKGIIIADTKFEFGTDAKGDLYLIDEVLTPDSSRFWPADEYTPGQSPPSFDKQFVRDYLESTNWDKTPPGPEIPESVITVTSQKYHNVETRLVGD